jgi:hypothetical protein
MSTEIVADAIACNWISKFGSPMELYSDQGANYESGLNKDVMALFGIRKTKTTPLHPRSDGMVERINRTTLGMLSKVVKHDQKDWDKRLPYLMMAYNNTPHDTTGFSPHRMMFGEEMMLPVEATVGAPPETKNHLRPREGYPYVNWLRKAMENSHMLARKHIKKAVEIQRRLYDRNVKPLEYKEGDLVRLHQHKVVSGRKHGLDRFWTGPWKVVRKYSEVVLGIRHNSITPIKIVHADSLKIYNGEQVPNWMKRPVLPTVVVEDVDPNVNQTVTELTDMIARELSTLTGMSIR